MPLTDRYNSRKEIGAAMRSRKNSGLFRKIAPDERIKLRFIVEIPQWERGYYHYIADADIKFMWCSRRKNCPRCEINHKPTPVWLANAVDIEAGKVQIIQVPAGIANQLYERFEKYKTICDRDYEISRKGSTLNDTVYMLDWDDKLKRNLSSRKPADIPAAILMELGLEPQDEESEDEVPSAYRGKTGSKKSSRYQEPDEDEDDEEEEDDQYEDLSRSELKSEIKKYDAGFVAKKSQSDEDLLQILRELASDEDDEEEEADDDEELEEDDEDEAQPPPKRGSASSPVRAGRSSSRRHPDEDDEDEEEDAPARSRSSKARASKPSSGLDEFRPRTTRNPGKLSTGKSQRIVRRA